MDIKTILKENASVDIISLINKYKKREIADSLNQIIKNDYKALNENETYIRNFLELVSYLYAYEQINRQKTEKKTSIKVKLFNKEFSNRLNDLRNYYVHNLSISR